MVVRIICSLLFIIITSGKSYAQKSENLAGLLTELKQAHDSLKPKIYSRIGFYYISRDMNDSALFYTRQGLQASEKVRDNKAIGNAYNNMGNIYRIYSDHEQAIALFTKALSIFDKYGYYKDAARTISNISSVFGEQQLYNKTIEQLYISNQYAKKAEDTITLIQNYSTLANTYSMADSFGKARTCLDSGLALMKIKEKNPGRTPVEAAQFKFASGFLNRILALQLYNEKKFDASIELYKKELAESEASGRVRTTVDIMEGLAENYIEIKKLDSALNYTNKALVLLKTDSIPKSYKDVYRLQTIIYEKMGLYKDAFYALQQFKRISDTISAKDKIATIANIQTRYETEKKDQQISQLNSEKKVQRIILLLAIGIVIIVLGLLVFAYRSRKLQQKLFRQKEELMMKEKEVEKKALEQKMAELEQMALRAQMNPHFIFNSLNSVQHFVMKQDMEGVNKYLSAFAHLIRQTLNNSGRQLISVAEEIQYLDTYLSLEQMKSNNHFTYSIGADPGIDTSNTFIPGMILQPFVENSIKHGVAHKPANDGFINIHISKNGKLVCSVEDNGIGRQRAASIKLNDAAEYESKGMDITMHRIEAINKMYNAEVSVKIRDVQDALGNASGTSVTVELPADME